jgi:hypothetical protein
MDFCFGGDCKCRDAPSELGRYGGGPKRQSFQEGLLNGQVIYNGVVLTPIDERHPLGFMAILATF